MARAMIRKDDLSEEAEAYRTSFYNLLNKGFRQEFGFGAFWYSVVSLLLSNQEPQEFYKFLETFSIEMAVKAESKFTFNKESFYEQFGALVFFKDAETELAVSLSEIANKSLYEDARDYDHSDVTWIRKLRTQVVSEDKSASCENKADLYSYTRRP